MAATTNNQGTPQPWWDLVPRIAPPESPVRDSDQANDVQARVDSVLSPLAPGDKQLIEQRLERFSADFAKARKQLDGMTASMAEHKFRQLRDELSKTDDLVPNATTITATSDWLLENLPTLGDSLVRVFATPAVGKVVGKAGPVAIAWVQQRLSGPDPNSNSNERRSASSLRI